MRMGPHVHAATGGKLGRPHMVVEHEGPDVPRLQYGQQPPHHKTVAQIVLATIDQDRLLLHIELLTRL
jgi:hypothetical protein